MENEVQEKQIFATKMFDNINALELQDIEFVKDERDHEAEFSNLKSISS